MVVVVSRGDGPDLRRQLDRSLQDLGALAATLKATAGGADPRVAETLTQLESRIGEAKVTLAQTDDAQLVERLGGVVTEIERTFEELRSP